MARNSKDFLNDLEEAMKDVNMGNFENTQPKPQPQKPQNKDDWKNFSQQMLSYIIEFMEKYKISTKEDQAAFIANIMHETGEGKSLIENPKYSYKAFEKLKAPGQDGIQNVRDWFAKHPDNAEAEFKKLSNIDKINIMYDGRKILGNTQEGDGYLFRGRGAIQLTGRDAYQNFANHMNRPDIMQNPDLIAIEPKLAAESAAWFWTKYHPDAQKNAKLGKFEEARKAVNGGGIGMKSAKALYNNYIKNGLPSLPNK